MAGNTRQKTFCSYLPYINFRARIFLLPNAKAPPQKIDCAKLVKQQNFSEHAAQAFFCQWSRPALEANNTNDKQNAYGFPDRTFEVTSETSVLL